MKKIRSRVIMPILMVISMLSGVLGAASTSYALGSVFSTCPGGSSASASSGGSSTGGTASSAICGATSSDFNTIIHNIINLLLYAIGVIAVVAIIIGGIRYTTANGDAGAVKSAKDTIMYAVIGLIVAVMAFTIVTFVLGRFK